MGKKFWKRRKKNKERREGIDCQKNANNEGAAKMGKSL